MTESAPPLSVYYPPSSHSSFTKLIPTALPPKSLSVSYSQSLIEMVLMIGNGHHDIIRLDETSFNGESAIYHKHECLKLMNRLKSCCIGYHGLQIGPRAP